MQTVTLPPLLSGVDDQLAEVLARLGLSVFRGNEGLGLTEALILTGYARDERALRARYQDAPEVIDRYLQEVNAEKLIAAVYSGERDLRSAQARAAVSDNPVPLALLSFAAGVAAGWLVS